MRRLSGLLSILLAVSLAGCNGCDEIEDGGISEVMKEWEKKLQRARAGLPTDFDGDGFEEYLQWIDKDGVIHIEIKHPSGNLFMASELYPDGTEIALLYEDGEEKPYEKAEEKPGSHYIYLMDTNGDGIFDERITNTFDLKKNENHRVFEEINSDGTTWRITLEETMPINRGTALPRAMGAVSRTQEGFLQGVVRSQYSSVTRNPTISSTITIVEGSCGIVGEQYLQGDFAKIFDGGESVIECFDKFNPEISRKLKKEVNQRPTVKIDCNLNAGGRSYPGADGLSSSNGRCNASDECTISFDPKIFNYDEADRISVVLHEYLHILGYGLNLKEHNKGADMVYSCGRYCAGGSRHGKGSPKASQTDCERCAAPTVKNKKKKCQEDCKKFRGVTNSKAFAAFRADEVAGDMCEDEPAGRVYCSCTGTVYENVMDCLDECKASLACFTGICHPVQ
jgi:hypothetical protein